MRYSGFSSYALQVNRGPHTLSAYLSREYFAISVLVFGAFFLTGKLGQYLLFNFDIAPALIWPPVGIALVAVFLWGPRLWFPVALAQLLLLLTSPFSFVPLVMIAYVFGNTLQPLVGAYVLHRLGFEGTMANTRCVLVFLGVALCVPAVVPLLITGAQMFVDTVSMSPWATFSRAWAGGVMSVLVVVPLITPWFRPLSSPIVRKEALETGAALLAVAGMTYVVFWTALPRLNVFVVLFLLFVAFFWVGLRLRPRFMTLAIFLLAAGGIAGSIIAMPTQTPLGQQLLADQLFIILVAPIFLILSAVVTERQRAVSQYKQHAQELERALKRLSAEDKAKAEFIATLAHELRNPLAPVMSALELLKIKSVPEDVLPLIDSAKIQTEHMKRLLDDLLDAARVAQQTFTLKKEPLELSSVVFRSIASTQDFLQSRKHRLSVSLPRAPVWIEADPVRFEQILVNLLNNAGKYTNPGGSIVLSGKKEGDTLVLSISDSGIGIEPERFGQIFDAFGGAEGNSRRPGGLRLGLSLAKRMTELHDGTLSVESAGRGKGSTFTLHFPLSSAPEPLRPPAPAMRQKTTSALSRSILIVDDNEAAALGLTKLLEHEGYTVHVAYDGKGALEAISRFSPEVVLLDIGLPDMDGYEVAERLRTRLGANASTPALVALSGYGQDSDKRRAQEAGFVHHLTKPVGIAELRRVIERINPTSSLGAVY